MGVLALAPRDRVSPNTDSRASMTTCCASAFGGPVIAKYWFRNFLPLAKPKALAWSGPFLVVQAREGLRRCLGYSAESGLRGRANHCNMERF